MGIQQGWQATLLPLLAVTPSQGGFLTVGPLWMPQKQITCRFRKASGANDLADFPLAGLGTRGLGSHWGHTQSLKHDNPGHRDRSAQPIRFVHRGHAATQRNQGIPEDFLVAVVLASIRWWPGNGWSLVFQFGRLPHIVTQSSSCWKTCQRCSEACHWIGGWWQFPSERSQLNGAMCWGFGAWCNAGRCVRLDSGY